MRSQTRRMEKMSRRSRERKNRRKIRCWAREHSRKGLKRSRLSGNKRRR